MSCSDTDGCEVERDLRARLAEVEAAHSCAANLWAHEVAKVAEQRDRAEAAEARLAAVESERGIWQETARRFCQNADYWMERTEAAEARLAEVEALCEDAKPWGRTLSPFEVRAAARGEGDRG